MRHSTRDGDVRLAAYLEELITALERALTCGAPASRSAPRAVYCYRRIVQGMLAHQAEWQQLTAVVHPVGSSLDTELVTLAQSVRQRWQSAAAGARAPAGGASAAAAGGAEEAAPGAMLVRTDSVTELLANARSWE